MNGSERQQSEDSQRSRRPSRSAFGAIAATLVLVASFVAIAFASGTAVRIGSASSSRLSESIAINAQGRTLYALSPETSGHLLCKSSECLRFWPPVTVPSRGTKLDAGPGLHGHLGILRRGNGTLQVTLRGLPLYRFLKDHAKGEVNGQGIESFGGTWHAVSAASPSTPAPGTPASPTPATPSPVPTTPSSPPMTPTPTPGYGY